MSDEITSGDIATAVEESTKSDSASPASHPDNKASATADTSTTASSDAGRTKANDFGPMPWERHEAILNHTRRDLEGKLSRLSWADQLKADEVREALELRDLARRNPKALIDRFKTTDAPQPDLKSEDGRFLFSAEGAAALARYEVQRAIADLKREYDDRFTPFETDRANSEQWNALQRDVQSASELPQFNEHLDAMTKYMAEMNHRRAQGEAIPILTAKDVYLAVVVPKLLGSKEQSVAEGRKAALADLRNTTARAGEDVNPANVPASSRKKDSDKSLAEIFAEEFSKRGVA